MSEFNLLPEDVARLFRIPILLEEGWSLESLFLLLVNRNQYRGQPIAKNHQIDPLLYEHHS
jgi:hypothetical protein